MLIVSLIGLANVISMFVVMKEARLVLIKYLFKYASDAITSVAVVLGAIVISIWKNLLD